MGTVLLDSIELILCEGREEDCFRTMFLGVQMIYLLELGICVFKLQWCT